MSIIPDNVIRILLIDRHALVRAGLRLLIESQPGFEVVGEASNPADALAIIAQVHPDIVLLEPVVDGDHFEMGALAQLAAAGEVRLIIVTAIGDPRMHYQVIQMGAMGVVKKEELPAVLMKAIQKVESGEAWVDRSTMAGFIQKVSRAHTGHASDQEAVRVELLTKREREVVELIGQGLKNRQIAQRLSISEVTVRHHLTSVFSKLQVTDRLELMIYAFRNKLATPPRQPKWG
jgi:two-component system nitrate/nitrite response regulator NarL